MQMFIVNSAQGPTANPKIRQAISAVVDVEEISAATGSVSKPNHSLVYPESPYYQGDKMKAYYDQKSPQKAKKLLSEAGYKGETITLQTTSSYANFRASILVLAELMKAAGMNVKVDVVDWTTNASNMQRGTGTWNVSTTSFCSNPLLGPQQWRTMFYTFPQVKSDEVMDKAYDQFYTALDDAKRKSAWDAIENQVLEQAYMIKIVDVGTINAYNSKRVENFGSFYLPRFWNVNLK
jgi:peptide/nickel transport system substrate-binding protein